jgi:hypothetical protein
MQGTQPAPINTELGRVTRCLWDRDVPPSELAEITPAALGDVSDARLVVAARLAGLPDDADFDRAQVAERLCAAIQALAGEQNAADPEADETRVAKSKFDLGQAEPKLEPEHIPWGYGHNRITGMCVDPQTLFCYWELTDDAIDDGKIKLGPAGAGAWINLRIYDVTGRIFDGTNAHDYQDHRVDRTDRHWFVHVGRPGATMCVEVGMKSSEGYFVRLARSGRVDFPRTNVAAPSPVEWLTVRTATGDLDAPSQGDTLASVLDQGAPGAHSTAPLGQLLGEPRWTTLAEMARSITGETVLREWMETGRKFEWVGPLIRTHWEAGPFPVPVEVPGPAVERYEGPVTIVTRDGMTRVVYGPWQVVIRGLQGWAERRVLATWEVFTSWTVSEGFARQLTSVAREATVGASEVLGASELRWLLGSEARLGGASEVFFLGASELRMLGASEQWLLGASEYRLLGGSEWRLVGASEWRMQGASEQLQWGGSEARLGGASESLPESA